MQNQALRFSLDANERTITVESHRFEQTFFKASFGLDGQVGETPLILLDEPWIIEEKTGGGNTSLPLTCEAYYKFSLPTNHPGVNVSIHFGLLQERPLLVLQMEVHNLSNQPILLKRLTLLQINPGNFQISGSQPARPAFYCNGWQSWSASGAYQQGSKQRRSILGPFQNPMVVNKGTPEPKGQNHFSSDMFGVLGDRQSRIGLLAGFLSQQQHFGSLETHFTPQPSLALWANGDGAMLPAGEGMATDWGAISFIDIDSPDPLDPYLSATADVNNIQSKASVPVGWCSWYHFYTAINEEVIQSNLNTVIDLQAEIPLPLFQIDDGFETHPGDWFDFTPGFPNGLTPLAQKIKKAGLTPGIWLAPFIVHPQAKLVNDHPDWLLRNEKGKPVNAGFVWNRFNYALDLTHPEALAYTKKVVQTAVEQWGFSYLKLDFLYAAALQGVFQDRTKTRAQVLRMGLETLREAAGPETILLGCGCPLGSGLGIFEAMRISADVSGTWEPHFPPVSFLLKKEPHMPSARNALQNILSRAFLHRHWWINDPDCLLVRPETELTLPELQSLATAIGLTGGSLLLSDDLPALVEDRLRLAQILLPVLDRRPKVIDWLDHYTPSMLRLDLEGPSGCWHLLAYFNWNNHARNLTFSPADFHLPEDHTWWAREFWTGEVGQISAKAPFTAHDVPKNGVRVLALRPYAADEPAYLGSNLHLSQGKEVQSWSPQENGLSFTLGLGHKRQGEVFLYLPNLPIGAWIDGCEEVLQDQGRGIYSQPLETIADVKIMIKY
jgi:alpha-galactosidase